MTTLFEEADNANPPSPSLELLDGSLKNELDSSRKVATNTSTATNDAVRQGISTTSSSTLGADSFSPFVNDPSQLSSNVRVVHVQTVPEGGNEHSGNVTGQANSGGTLYTVGGGSHIQQVITPSDSSGLATVTVDGNQQDNSRYTYYPAVQSNDGNQGGQFYVMMSPQDVIPVTGNSGPRIIAPRSQSLTQLGDGTFTVEPSDESMPIEFRKVVEPTRSSRDERRRATHNEVERRRRDKINTWIMKLAAVVPDCQMDQSKQGTSKGGVLSKALDHIIKLRTQNDRMAETIKEQERILVENQVLRQQVEKLRQENAILHANLQLRQGEQEPKNLESD